MNFRSLRSPRKSVPHALQSLSRARAWIAGVVLLIFCTGTALASPGTLVANGLNQPRGAIRWNGSVWVADIANGFCRIDSGVINLSTCFAAGNGQPELDGNLVYITDATGATGIWRLTMNAINSTIDSAVQLAPNGGLAGNLPQSASLGPDGKLYVSFTSTGDIKRITNPAGDPATQTVESVGKAASGGGPVNGLSFVNGDLYIADTGLIGLERIANAAACRGNCNATAMFGVLGISNSVSSDRTRYLFMENGTRVLRYDATTTNVVVIYSQNGIQNGQTFSYGQVWGVTYDLPTGDVFIGGDPTAPGAATNNVGSLYVVTAPATTEGAVQTQFGPPPPAPSPTPIPPAARTGALYAAGITQPNGLTWIGTHAWVSDSSQGFCRVDSSSPGVAALSNCFKPVATFVPGQAYFDSVRSLVYVPDAAAASSGIYRVVFDPTTESLGLSANLGQGNLQPTAVAIAPEGSLFVGSRNNGNINKITTPSTTPAAPIRVATTSNGLAVRGMLFIGNDLYLAETVNVTVIIRASPSLTKGKAVIVGPAATRGATPRLNIVNPLSLAADTRNPSHALLYIGSAPLGIGDFGQVDQWDILLQKDTIWADSGIIGAVTTAFSNVGGLAVAPDGSLYAGDDPSVTTAGTTATPGQGHIYQLAP
ncbi:MAG TPA: hypothetical protein VJN64_12010 [Terriglobales bacterium]|nr:hypothetical protein [Terriglobales bacterium]